MTKDPSIRIRDRQSIYGKYWSISRLVDGTFRFGPEEKDAFVSLMRRCEQFCGVRIVTYVVMSNHFHLLVEVPKAPSNPMSDDELWARAEELSGEKAFATLRQRWNRFLENADEVGLQMIRKFFTKRMWNVSEFMKALKQRFTRWFNKRHARRGTLWEERFKSMLVEGQNEALTTIAAYIDLNPIRANIVSDPAEYPWCGYAEAMAGGRLALNGLRIVSESFCLSGGEPMIHAEEALERYRTHLYVDGVERLKTCDGAVVKVRLGFDRVAVAEMIANRGKLTREEALRCRVRVFSDGGALGSKAFVASVFQSNRSQFGPNRKTAARDITGNDLPGLHALRALRVDVIL